MKYQLDEKLRTHFLWFDGPLDLLETTTRRMAEIEAKGATPYWMKFWVNPSSYWPERTGTGWQAFRDFIGTPWPHAMKMIQVVVDHVAKAVVADLKDTRRKMRWDENAGEVDVFRAMDGEAEYMRRSVRTRVSVPPHVTLLCNLDATVAGCNKSGVYYRSAVGMAVADKLEHLGYGVDVVAYCLGTHVYPDPHHVQLVACRPKKAGDPVDFNTMCDAMSEWFTRNAIFGSFACSPVLPVRLGYAVQPNADDVDPWATPLAPWLRLLDLEQGTVPILVPMASGHVDDAVRAAEAVLNRIKELGA